MSELADLTRSLRAHGGVRSKELIQGVAKAIGGAHRSAWTKAQRDIINGDDAAAIADGEGYLLLAAEGIAPELVTADPWFAGFCSVMVNVSDIAAMGGVPFAVADVLFVGASVDNARLLQGMADASAAFGVPIVGGHTSRGAEQTWLSVSILGRAKRLLSSFAARPGQSLVCAVDLRGAYRGDFNHFNAATSATRSQLRRNVGLLSSAAELGLAVAAKDISQAGLVGTLTMLCESSGVGARLELESVPGPAGVSALRWLTTFPSFGFLLACEPDRAASLVRHFQEAGVSASEVGGFDDSRQVTLAQGDDRSVFWDLEQASLTGFGRAASGGSAQTAVAASAKPGALLRLARAGRGDQRAS